MKIVEKASGIIDPNNKQMKKSGSPKLYKENADKDDPKYGYSRNPFKPIDPKHIDDIAIAAICYLLRGHALFFCRPRIKRDFNAAKTALNDFQQANQLAWRLYEQIEGNHHSHAQPGLEAFYSGVLKDAIQIEGSPLQPQQPGSSFYFI